MTTTQAALLEALKAAKACILIDRTALADCHTGPDGLDEDGADGVAQYDETLAKIDAALRAADAAQPEPFGYIAVTALNWLNSPTRSKEAYTAAVICKTPSGNFNTPIYRSAPPQPAPIAAQADAGMVWAPHWRGYANLGTGNYRIDHSAEGSPAELVVSIATEADKAGRSVGEDRENPPGELLYPEQMAVRIRFENVAGLDALEKQLRYLRDVHFPSATPTSAPPAAAPQAPAEPAAQAVDWREYLEAMQRDHQRLVRELDVALNGPDRAAPQASLCDLVSQVSRMVSEGLIVGSHIEPATPAAREAGTTAEG